jgi:hypothetical protein
MTLLRQAAAVTRFVAYILSWRFRRRWNCDEVKWQ